MKTINIYKKILLFVMILLFTAGGHTEAAAKVRLSKTSITLCTRNTYQLKLKGAGKKVKWSSSNKKVASVSSKGKVTAKKKGTCTITGKSNGKSYRAKVKVQSAKLNVSKKTLETGKTFQLKAKKSSGTVRWKSNNKSVAKISAGGEIKAIAPGTAVITAKIKQGVLQCKVIVVAPDHVHNYILKSEREPSCTKAGSKIYACSCGDSFEEKSNVLGHNYVKRIVDPACVGKGYIEYTCSRDSSHIKRDTFTDALGHDFGEEQIISEPQCVKTGLKSTICKRCGDQEQTVIPALGHQYEDGICKVCHAEEASGVSQDNIMKVRADAEEIQIHIKGVGSDVNETASILRTDPNEYVAEDKISGISEERNAHGELIGQYNCGTEINISMNRYDENGKDNLYSKFYIVSRSGLLKGPVYPSEIQPTREVAPFTGVSKKGLLGENFDWVKETGSSYTALNFDMTRMIYANEDTDGNLSDSVKRNTYTWKSQGETYFFDRAYIDEYDKKIKQYTDANIGVSLILLGWKSDGWEERYPAALTYGEVAKKTSVMGINTSNEKGMNYWIAAMEFLAERYSRTDNSFGRIINLVLGNEVDYPYAYNLIMDGKAPLDVYMEEYSRLMRLTHLAVSKYMDTVTITMSLTHFWAVSGGEIADVETGTLMDPSIPNSYAPKKMTDWLNKKTKEEGDYNWGLSPHCYALSLAGSYCTEDDSITGRRYGMTGDYNTSSTISFANLEILDEYLHQPELMYNNQVRKMFLTESGCSSYLCTLEDYNRQAAYVAAAYYKCALLDSVEAFIYYRAIDHAAELASSMASGLLNSNHTEKPAYKVFEYMDTQYYLRCAQDYLGYAAYYDEQKAHHTVGNGKLTSYEDLIHVFSDKTKWDASKIARRTVPSVEVWDDEKDLGSVRFMDRSFVYDNNEHSVTISGELPEGVTVEYENNSRTERGSQEAVAHFMENGREIGKRTATLTIGDFMTNKVVYEYGEKIYVTASSEATDPWVGIYLEGDKVGSAPAIYWYYINDNDHIPGNTYILQDGVLGNDRKDIEDVKNLPAGNYKILLMHTNTATGNLYEEETRLDITILPEGEKSEEERLDGISFEDAEFLYDGTEHRLEISGELPEGITVEYVDNARTKSGVNRAVAIFKKDNKILEYRMARLSITDVYSLETDKTEYLQGEPVMVTAIGSGNDWAAIYSKDDTIGSIDSIYWYYVADASHIPGQSYNIANEIYNSTRAEYKELPAGEYMVVLLEKGGYNVLEHIDITIKESLASTN